MQLKRETRQKKGIDETVTHTVSQIIYIVTSLAHFYDLSKFHANDERFVHGFP